MGEKEHLLNIIDNNIHLGIEDNIINISHLSWKILNLLRIENYHNVSVYYEPKPIGVFGGIYSIINGSNCDFDLFIHNSDIYFDGELKKIFSNNSDIVFGMINNGKKDFQIDNNKDIVFNEIDNYLGYSGIMLIKSKVLKFFKNKYTYNTYLNFITDFIDISKANGITLGATILKGNWFDLGTLEGLQKAQITRQASKGNQ